MLPSASSTDQSVRLNAEVSVGMLDSNRLLFMHFLLAELVSVSDNPNLVLGKVKR